MYQHVLTCTNMYQPAGCRPLLTNEQRQIWLWMMPCYRLCLSMICSVRHKNNAWPDHDRETSRHLLPTKRGRPTQQNETALKNVCPHNIFRSTCISDNKIYPQSYILLDHIISYLAFEVKSSLGGSCKQTEKQNMRIHTAVQSVCCSLPSFKPSIEKCTNVNIEELILMHIAWIMIRARQQQCDE